MTTGTGRPRLGLVHINIGATSRPDALVGTARLAEDSGFDAGFRRARTVSSNP
ncbi:MAG: hypothetical protein ACRD08_18815 [Acidimicrobiales bacterium]